MTAGAAQILRECEITRERVLRVVEAVERTRIAQRLVWACGFRSSAHVRMVCARVRCYVERERALQRLVERIAGDASWPFGLT